jgi:hypothetical protein
MSGPGSVSPAAMFLVIDQLPAAWLGPYGNTTHETDSLDALAADSLLFDFAFVDSLELQQGLNLMWGFGGSAPERSADLFQRLRDGGLETVLLTDDPGVANHPQASFDQVILIGQNQANASAREVADTQLACFFAELAAWLENSGGPGQLCWVHSRGFSGSWDAPYFLRQHFAGLDDPEPPGFLDLGSIDAATVAQDPDQQLGLMQAAAAQVTVLDQCLGMLQTVLDECFDRENFLLVVTSTRGCALGEHQKLGLADDLHTEMVQVPLMIRLPQSTPEIEWPTGRSSRFISPSEISSLLPLWLTGQTETFRTRIIELDRVLPDRQREVKWLLCPGQKMIQTHAWKLLQTADGTTELYAKPDDRWEINNVANRCPKVVEQLREWLQRLSGGGNCQRLLDGSSSDLLLPDLLTLRHD